MITFMPGGRSQMRRCEDYDDIVLQLRMSSEEIMSRMFLYDKVRLRK